MKDTFGHQSIISVHIQHPFRRLSDLPLWSTLGSQILITNIKKSVILRRNFTKFSSFLYKENGDYYHSILYYDKAYTAIDMNRNVILSSELNMLWEHKAGLCMYFLKLCSSNWKHFSTSWKIGLMIL